MTVELHGNATMSVATTSTAAAANHFSCCRSSPADRANLTTSAITLTTRAARTKNTGTRSSSAPAGKNG